MKGDLITTHTDRLRHMEKCRKWDRAWKQEHGGNLPPEQHYENVGDIASTNNWMYHHFKGLCQHPELDLGHCNWSMLDQ